MALAIHLEALIHSEKVPSYAVAAKLAHVTRARMTQISQLTLLAPDIQEVILHLASVESGPDTVTERDLRSIVAECSWDKQRQMWRRLRDAKSLGA